MKDLKKTFILLIILLNYSCNNDNNINSINEQIATSDEYNNYVDAFSKLKQIDLKISSESMKQVRDGKTTKKEYVENFNNLIVPSRKSDAIKYFKTLGIDDVEEILLNREYIFSELIPKATNELGEKFPVLKGYSASEMEKLRKLSVN